MPGPGGGSRGGGGFRGGSFGGGGHRGGFGGPRPGGFRPHPGGFGPRPGPMPMGGWHSRRHHNVGGGCMGALFAPVIIILLMVFSIIWLIGDSEGSYDLYNEEVFQDYANSQYQAEFGSSSAYEDNILIVFLTAEDHYEYAYIAWVGDHIVMDINYMLGAEGTELGSAMEYCINRSNYKYSLDTDLSFVIGKLTEAAEKMGLESSFGCDEKHIQVTSHLSNHTTLEMNEQVVNDALTTFTAKTGIPIVLVVEDMEDVFVVENAVSEETEFSAWPILLVAVVVIVIIVVVSKRKKDQRDFGTPEKDSRYHDFDDQY